MTECIAPGWGSGPYGQSAWTGSLSATPGGNLPVQAPFDVYCVGPCGPMSVFDSYLEVDANIPLGQSEIVPAVEDYRLFSGTSPAQEGTAWIYVDMNIPFTWTMEFTLMFNSLPTDFSSLQNRHIFLGTVDQQGYSAGLFFSKVGLAYTGNVLHNGANLLELNSILQVIPGSFDSVVAGQYYTVRIALDSVTATVFIYLTKTSDIPSVGHQLLAILPAIPTSSSPVTPTDGTVISVKGVVGQPSDIQLDSICVGTGMVIPNLPPVADAGKDQAAQTCTVIRLDAGGSFDPEGAPLAYKWRLTGTPLPSSFGYQVDDGRTITPTPFASKLYSEKLGDYHADVGISVGDVLLFEGIAYDIVSVGSDGSGFYVQASEFALPAPITNKMAKVIRQGTINGVTAERPTFYPDVSGIFKFDLTVYDGVYYSEPAGMIVNVTESPIPRGCTPDLSFMWNYLLDSWNLVENKEMISVFWSALAQVTASEMLTLWQHEYSKSLRDVPRAFQRRWLHYDLYIPEPVISSTKIRMVWSGVESNVLAASVVPGGGKIVVSSPLFDDISITFSGSAAVTIDSMVTQLQQRLRKSDKRFKVEVISSGSLRKLFISAPFSFALTEASTATNLFSFPAYNDLPSGTAGAAIGMKVYKVERGLGSTEVKAGDFLVVDGMAFRIVSLATDPSDTWAKQRVVLDVELPVTLSSSWKICGVTSSVFLDFYNALVSEGDIAFYEVVEKATGQAALVPAAVVSAAEGTSGGLLTEMLGISSFLSQPETFDVFFYAVHRRRYMPVDKLVVGVPYLQEKIKTTDDQEVLRQNIDYFLEEYRGRTCLRFVTTNPMGDEGPDVWEGQVPPERLWAETTYVDNMPVIEQNFGLAVDFDLEDKEALDENIDYLSAVRGLWYAHFNGPTMKNLRAGTQILLGLPFAEEAGKILEIDPRFSPNQGRILVEDASNQQIVRSYEYPRGLELEINPLTLESYKVGDTLSQFAPMVEGVEIVDRIKDPKWFEGYLNQGLMFEVEKFNKFLVRVDSKAFSLSTLLFVKSFILRIKPKYTYPLFLVLAGMGEDTTVSTSDLVEYGGTLYFVDGVSFVQVGSAYSALGGTFDDARAATGGWQNKFDSNEPADVAPTYPGATQPIYWGYDKTYLVPTDLIYGTILFVANGITLPQFDMVLNWDSVVLTERREVFQDVLLYLPNVLETPKTLGLASVTASPILVDTAIVDINTIGNLDAQSLRLYIYLNGVLNQSVDFVTPACDFYRVALPLSSVLIGSGVSVTVAIGSTGGGTNISWATILVHLGEAYAWTYDQVLPAGTYAVVKSM